MNLDNTNCDIMPIKYRKAALKKENRFCLTFFKHRTDTGIGKNF